MRISRSGTRSGVVAGGVSACPGVPIVSATYPIVPTLTSVVPCGRPSLTVTAKLTVTCQSAACAGRRPSRNTTWRCTLSYSARFPAGWPSISRLPGANVVPGGSGSVSTASFAASSPTFLTDIVYVSRSPACAAPAGATALVDSIRGANNSVANVTAPGA